MSEKSVAAEKNDAVAGDVADAPVRRDADRRRIVRRGIVATLVGGTFWGLNGTVSKWLMDAYAIDPLWLVCLRELTACWLFLGAAALTARGREQLTGVWRSPRDLLAILGVSFAAILFSQVSYLEAIDWTNSATATIMQSLGMVLVLVYVCLKMRRSPRRREILGVALALVGTYLVATGGNPGQLNLPLEGLVWGLGCALASACLSILPAGPMARWGNFTVNGLAFLFSGIALALWYRPWEHMPALDGVAIVVLALCVVVGTFGAYALYLQGVKDAGSMRASLLGTIEPVTATIASIVWLATPFSLAEIVGFVLIIVMVYLTA